MDDTADDVKEDNISESRNLSSDDSYDELPPAENDRDEEIPFRALDLLHGSSVLRRDPAFPDWFQVAEPSDNARDDIQGNHGDANYRDPENLFGVDDHSVLQFELEGMPEAQFSETQGCQSDDSVQLGNLMW